MIVVGVILLLVGFVAHIAILWTIGVVVLVIGLALMQMGKVGHAVAGRHPLLLTPRQLKRTDRQASGRVK